MEGLIQISFWLGYYTRGAYSLNDIEEMPMSKIDVLSEQFTVWLEKTKGMHTGGI